MIVNGKEITIQDKISVKDFLEKEGYDINKVVVERNGEIIPKKNITAETFSNTDKIEIVCFVGGG